MLHCRHFAANLNLETDVYMTSPVEPTRRVDAAAEYLLLYWIGTALKSWT